MSRPPELPSLIRALSEALGDHSLENIYRNEILKLKTRRVHLFGRKCRPQVLYTFLGYELKAMGKRITCPDLATVRYLTIFAELGMEEIQIPFDPTQTERHLDGLKHAQRTLQRIVADFFPADPEKQKSALRALYAWTRRRLRAAAPSPGP